MTDEEFDFLAEDLKQIVIDDFVVIAESEGKVVGFALGLPDINQAFKFNKGGSLIGAIYCLLFKKKILQEEEY